MKYVLIALLSSPVMLAYQLKPTEMQDAFARISHYVLQQIVR